MKHLLIGAATALALAAPASAQDATAASGADAATVLATVNGTDITLGHLIALRSRLPQQYQELPDDVLFEGMLDQIIQQQILTDADEPTPADRIGVENEVRAYLSGRAIERLMAAGVGEADVQAAYDEQYGSVEPATEYNASHILVETEEEAQAIVAEVEGGADFAEVARGKSTGPSGPNGGELGWFGEGMMVPAFEEAVAGMEAGAVSAPVETQFGWHVIKLIETRDAVAPALEEVRPQLEAQMREAAVQAEVERLTADATVDRPEVDLDPALIRNDDLLGD